MFFSVEQLFTATKQPASIIPYMILNHFKIPCLCIRTDFFLIYFSFNTKIQKIINFKQMKYTAEVIQSSPEFNTEGILYAQIETDEIIQSQMNFDPAGHYHRQDTFEFTMKNK